MLSTVLYSTKACSEDAEGKKEEGAEGETGCMVKYISLQNASIVDKSLK